MANKDEKNNINVQDLLQQEMKKNGVETTSFDDVKNKNDEIDLAGLEVENTDTIDTKNVLTDNINTQEILTKEMKKNGVETTSFTKRPTEVKLSGLKTTENKLNQDVQAINQLKQYKNNILKEQIKLQKLSMSLRPNTDDLDRHIGDLTGKIINELKNLQNPEDISTMVAKSYQVALNKIKEDKINTFNEVKENYIDTISKYKAITGQDINSSQDLMLLDNASAELYSGISILEKYKNDIYRDIEKKTNEILRQHKEKISSYYKLMDLYKSQKQSIIKDFTNKEKLITEQNKIYDKQLKLADSQMKELGKEIDNNSRAVYKFYGIKGDVENLLNLNKLSENTLDTKATNSLIDGKIKEIDSLIKDKSLAPKDITYLSSLKSKLLKTKESLNIINSYTENEIDKYLNALNKDNLNKKEISDITNKVVDSMFKNKSEIVKGLDRDVAYKKIYNLVNNKSKKYYLDVNNALKKAPIQSVQDLENISTSLSSANDLFTNYKDTQLSFGELGSKIKDFVSNKSLDYIKDKVLKSTKIKDGIKKRILLDYIDTDTDIEGGGWFTWDLPLQEIEQNIKQDLIEKYNKNHNLTDNDIYKVVSQYKGKYLEDMADQVNSKIKDSGLIISSDDLFNYVKGKIKYEVDNEIERYEANKRATINKINLSVNALQGL